MSWHILCPKLVESGTIRRIGGNEYIKVDVRVIAATNRDMQTMVAEGQFRQDLYYRLSAFPIHIPLNAPYTVIFSACEEVERIVNALD